jgi:HPt (histidine-containing phosphotransfer) domain-containing protein
MALNDNADLAILDLEVLDTLLSLDNFQGAFLEELIQLFGRDSLGVCERLIKAIETNSATEAIRMAHKLKGMGANLGTQRLGLALQRIETEFGSFDERTRAALPELIWTEYHAAVNALQAWVGKKVRNTVGI